MQLPLKISQTAALLEVVHAATGLVRSPVAITAMQVASRIWCLWGIVVPCAPVTIYGGIPAAAPYLYKGIRAQLNLVSLLTAWCSSEVVRYGFFALKEVMGTPPYFATWLR